MKVKKITHKNFYQVSGWMILNYKLKSNRLIAYAIIYGFSQDQETYFEGSINYLASFMNCAPNTVKATLKSLVEDGLLEKIDYYENNVKYCRYKALLPEIEVGQKLPQGGRAEIAPGGRAKNDQGGRAKIAPNNNVSNNNYINKLTKEECVLSLFEDLYKKRFETEFSYTGKFKRPYQLESIRRIIDLKKDQTELFLKKCFQINDNFLSKRLTPRLILENLNLFTLNLSAEKNNKRSDYPFLTHAQVLEKSNGVRNAFADYCRIKKGNSYVYVTLPIAEEYELKVLKPGEK